MVAVRLPVAQIKPGWWRPVSNKSLKICIRIIIDIDTPSGIYILSSARSCNSKEESACVAWGLNDAFSK